MLIEGYRPGKGDGGRWTGVIDKPRKTSEQSTSRNESSGRFMESHPPKGGSAIQQTGKTK
jgi:hypothetical protein